MELETVVVNPHLLGTSLKHFLCAFLVKILRQKTGQTFGILECVTHCDKKIEKDPGKEWMVKTSQSHFIFYMLILPYLLHGQKTRNEFISCFSPNSGKGRMVEPQQSQS